MKKIIIIFTFIIVLLFLYSSIKYQSATYEWDFGDGSAPAYEQNPGHVYTEPGTCSWTLKVTSNGEISQRTGTITIYSNDIPKIGLSRDSLNFASVNQTVTESQSVIISNNNLGTLNWSVSDYQNWLSCSPISGTNSGVITVNVDSSGLSAGTYTGAI